MKFDVVQVLMVAFKFTRNHAFLCLTALLLHVHMSLVLLSVVCQQLVWLFLFVAL